MIAERLEKHLKLCARNLKSNRVKCCASCPWEDEIVAARPQWLRYFESKRKRLKEIEWAGGLA